MLDDVRVAARALMRDKGLTAAALLCLALGIGGTTIVYSVTSALVLRPVPTADPSGLVVIGEIPPSAASSRELDMAPANYVDLSARNRSFSELAAFTTIDANVTGIDDPERVTGFRVTPSYFHVLRVQPVLGRLFTDDDANYTVSPDVVILSDGLWRRRFAADPGVVGRTIQLNGVPRTIVGVMAPGLNFPPGAELWTPLSVAGAFGRERDGRTLRGAIGRLRSGVSLAQAQRDVQRIMQQLQREYPGDDGKWGMRVEWADAFYGQHLRPFMLAEVAAILLVLLIACANVANLLLARSTTRYREIAVRLALGASRGRIVREHLLESLLFALGGGALGAMFAVWGVAAVRSILPSEQVRLNPGWTRIEVNGGVLAFTAAVSILTAFVVGVVPAIVASAADPQHALNEDARGASSGRARSRLRGLLVTVEMALALTMLAGTMVTLRSFEALARETSGYRADHALTMELTAPYAVYGRTTDADAMYDRVLARLRAEPGVVDAAFATALPTAPQPYTARIFLDGERRPMRGDPARAPQSRTVTTGYFATMGIPVVEGRVFTNHDDSSSVPVVVVSESLARSYWPGQSAVGQRIGCACNDPTMWTIVGVVRDVRLNPNAGAPVQPTMYWPVAQMHAWRTMSLVVRTRSDPGAMTANVVHAIASVAPAVAPGSIFTLAELQRASLTPQRISSEMMAAFAVVALMLAGLGIHGVMSYSVAQRTRDIGIRTALGARRVDVLRTVLGTAARPVGIGIVAGLFGAVVMTRTLAHLLTHLSPNDPLAFGAGIVVLVLGALVGSYLPARRALRTDPMVALRKI